MNFSFFLFRRLSDEFLAIKLNTACKKSVYIMPTIVQQARLIPKNCPHRIRMLILQDLIRCYKRAVTCVNGQKVEFSFSSHNFRRN